MKRKIAVQARINGQEVEFLCSPEETLLEVLRDTLGLTGTKEGCSDGNCGACAVLLEGRQVNSCLVLAVEIEGKDLTTIEGLGGWNTLDPVQKAFVREDALQCGFCTPGFVVATRALLDADPNPSETTIRNWLAGNLCRCTGYDKIIRAVKRAATVGESGVEDGEPAGPGRGDAVGSRPSRVDAVDKVTGRAQFGADFTLPGTLVGMILRSPHAHARVTAIDTGAAEAMEGVLAVVTAEDLPAGRDEDVILGEGTANFRYLCDNVLASDRVLYHGHAVAAVAAVDRITALRALSAIEVSYEELPAVMDVMTACQASSSPIHPDLYTRTLGGKVDRPSNVAQHLQYRLGDPEAGFAEADVVVEREYRSQMVHQGYIEPTTATASWSEDGMLTIYATTQGSFTMQGQIAELLRLPLSRIRVIPKEVGGAFGGKITSYLEVPAALLARKTGRPVRITMDRQEVLTSTGPTAGAVIRVKVGALRDGTLTAASAELFYEAGAYPGSPVGSAASNMFASYNIPNGQIDGYDVVVNKPRTAAYRAPGLTPAVFASEQCMNDLAKLLGLDPIEFRLRNCPSEGDRRINGTRHGNIGCRQVLEETRKTDHYRSELKGPHRGRGLALGMWGNWGAPSSCLMTLNADGTVSLTLGTVDLTGTRTSLAMVAADALQIPFGRIRPQVGDSSSVGFSEVSAGSRTTVATSQAVLQAASKLLAEMTERAANLWSIDQSDVRYEDGHFRGGKGGNSRSFEELAAEVVSAGGPVSAAGSVNVREWGAAFGVHIADVEVDPETGQVTLLRYTVVQDVGHAIHPGQVEGQMQGGAAQGIGWALYEGYRWDDEGHVLNANLLDYKLPTALDLPMIETRIVEVPYPPHPLGARGVGEIPIVPPAGAMAAAVDNALDVHMTRLPMSQDAILAASRDGDH